VTNKQPTYQQILLLLKNRFFWSIFFLLLIHISGAIGMVFFDKEIFASMTPYNLIVMFVILVGNELKFSVKFMAAFLTACAVGYFSEFLGINYGVLFGNYAYGDVLGFKLFDVPLLIGINWFSTVFCSFVATGKLLNASADRGIHFVKLPIIYAMTTAAITTAFDWLMEPVAVRLGFWSWENGQIPFYNYVCWFVISFFLARCFLKLKVEVSNPFATWLLLVQTAFFLFLRIFL
jgi:putative membrane protein